MGNFEILGKFLIDFDSILDAKYGKQIAIIKGKAIFGKEAELICLNN